MTNFDGIGAVMATVLQPGQTAHKVRVGDNTATLHAEGKWSSWLKVNMDVTILKYRVSWADDGLHFHVADGSGLLLHPHEDRGCFGAMELFSGLGGWSQAAKVMNIFPEILVDSHLETARACAVQFDCKVMKASEYVTARLNGETFRVVVLHDKVEHIDTWIAAGLANVNVVLGSPPCPPWSGAGGQKGLNSVDGLAFQATLNLAALLRVPFVILENVPGFPKHEDYKVLIRSADEKGMRLMLSGTFQCSSVIPVNRERWLGTFVYKGVHTDESSVQRANSFSFMSPDLHSFVRQPSLSCRDVLHVHMSEVERSELQVTEDVKVILANPEFAPWWIKQAAKALTAETVLQARVNPLEKPLQCIMASYGSQHLLDANLLKTKGLHAVVCQDDVGLRMFSPFEFAAVLGYNDQTVLSSDLKLAWQQTGNGIAGVHAWLQMCKTHMMCGETSPFSPMGDPANQLQDILSKGMCLSHFQTVVSDDLWKLMPVQDVEPKRQKVEISPTIPFHVAEEGCMHPPQVESENVLRTQTLANDPEFVLHDDGRVKGAAGQIYQGGCIVLLHAERHWMMMVNAAGTDVIANVVTKGLPHAKAGDFAKFEVGSDVVAWHDSISLSCMKKLVFHPVPTIISCQEQSLRIALQIKIDVTWTTKAVVAFAAARIGCLPDVLMLKCRDVVLPPEEFVMDFGRDDFQLQFRAVVPKYVGCDDPSTADPGMCPAGFGNVRWIARHPTRKIVRTCLSKKNGSLGNVVQRLFEDFHGTVSWSVFCDGKEVDQASACDQIGRFQVQWNGFRPLPLAEVIAVANECPTIALDGPCPGMVKRWIRSPFKVKPDEILCFPQEVVGEVAARFMLLSARQVSMICMLGTQVIDPMMRISDVDCTQILSVRVCPLIGGAKHDAVKSRLRQMLTARGVSDDKVGDRVQGLLAKVAVDKIAALSERSDEDAWKSIKDLASEAKFRLVTSAELKAHQKVARSSKSSGSKPGNASQFQKKQKFAPVASAIRVDPLHFKANGDNVQLLEVGRFGPDQSGMCLVSPVEADKCLQSQVRSADALALLVVGHGAQKFGPVFTMPAHAENGQPILVQAALKQCGDIPIEFVLSLPTAQVQQSESTVIEFSIVKSQVRNWSDAAVPLHYIGVHVAALRGSNLLAVWSVKAWANDKVVHHGSAQHWHGYFRISDSLLPQVLARSGAAGIFLHPKTEDRRHDPRFVSILMPCKQLSEVLSKAESCADSLGVTRQGETFGVRCRREHATRVRALILPESAYVETAAVDHTEPLFIAKNVPQVGREELTAALKQTGWDATAVRPQGINRWIIAAKEPPITSHVVINDSIILVEQMGRKSDTVPVTMVARQVKVESVVDMSNNTVTVSSTSRIQEMRAEVEAQLVQAMDSRMQSAYQKIDSLQQALVEVQGQQCRAQTKFEGELHQLRDEQQFTRQKIQDVESTVAAGSQTLLAQMQQMMSSMQQDIIQSVKAAAVDPDKRPRLQ